MSTTRLKFEFSLLGGWRQIEDPLPPDDIEWRRWLTENGYYGSCERIGDEVAGWSVELYTQNEKSKVKPKYPHLVVVSNPDRVETIFCVDFISAVELTRLYAPLVTASLISGIVEDCQSLLSREREASEEDAQRKHRELQAVKAQRRLF